MSSKDPSKYSDSELLEEFKKIKPAPMTDAFIIGFLVGIILFGVVVNAWGFFTLIPLYMIYLFLKKPKRYNGLKKELEKRNLEEDSPGQE